MVEAREHFSAGEQIFDLWRRRLGLPLGPLLGLGSYLLLSSLPANQRRLSAVLVLVVVYWITEAIPIPATALLGPSLCILAGVGPPQDIFRFFADPIIFVFLGSFLIAQAMAVNGLDRRAAIAILCSPFIRGSPGRIRLAIGAASTLMSMWMSNTATVAILFPIVIGISETMDRIFARGDDRLRRAGLSYSTGLMLITAYGASIGGLATPVGTPPNLIGLGMIDQMAGRRIPFFQWMLLGVPVTLVLFGVLVALLRFLHPAPKIQLEGLEQAVDKLREGLPAWGLRQTYTLVAFLTAVVLWVTPGFVAIVLGTNSDLFRLLGTRLHEGVVALLAASLLFLLPVNWKPLRGALLWSEAVTIDWGTVLLFGGGLSLGGLMYSTGLAQRMAQGLLGVNGHTGTWMIASVATAFAILITETTSNTAAASMVVPVTIAVAKAAGASAIPAALGATIGASLAFMLPVSTPPNAIMYGSGRVTILQMLRAGVLLDCVGFVVLMILLRFLCPLLGLI